MVLEEIFEKMSARDKKKHEKLVRVFIKHQFDTGTLFFQRLHRDVYISLRHKSSSDANQSPFSDFVMTKSKYAQNDPKQIQLIDALVIFTAGGLMPFSVVDSNHFRNLCEQLDPRFQMPRRKYLSSKLLQEKSSEIENNLKLRLKKAQSVCLTINLWSNRQMKGFLGITGHFIVDWTLKSVMIACKRFTGKHT